MHKSITRTAVAAAASAALGALAVTGVTAADAATGSPQQARAPSTGATAAAVPGAQLWVKRYTGSGTGFDAASSVTVSPSGGAVFVTGTSVRTGTGEDYTTIAYNAATGAQRWLKRYNGPGNSYDHATKVAVSPGGTRVFVTGYSHGTTPGADYATVAYSTGTGTQLWVKRYNGPGNGFDIPSSVAVSPGGGTVYVTGHSVGATTDEDYTTIAYNAATGAQLWVKRYNGAGNSIDEATSLAVSPTGSTVFVTGFSTGTATAEDYATIAYNAATGAQRWVKRYNGPGNAQDGGRSVAVSPGGGTVFVTGESYQGTATGEDYATIAYNAATGAQRWVKRYNGPGNAQDGGRSVAVSPGGGTVFVTGYSNGTTTNADYATIGYSAATGAQLWVRRYSGPGNGFDVASAVAVSPGGGTVFVTGFSTGTTTNADYATIAYRAATGAQLWVRRYNGPNRNDFANGVAVSPTGGKVFVTGQSYVRNDDSDWATVAYSG